MPWRSFCGRALSLELHSCRSSRASSWRTLWVLKQKGNQGRLFPVPTIHLCQQSGIASSLWTFWARLATNYCWGFKNPENCVITTFMNLQLHRAWLSVCFDLPGEPNHNYLFNKQGKDFSSFLTHPLNHDRKNYLCRSSEKLFNLFLKASRDGSSTASSVNLFQCCSLTKGFCSSLNSVCLAKVCLSFSLFHLWLCPIHCSLVWMPFTSVNMFPRWWAGAQHWAELSTELRDLNFLSPLLCAVFSGCLIIPLFGFCTLSSCSISFWK